MGKYLEGNSRDLTKLLPRQSSGCTDKENKLRGLSQRKNYTDRETAACWRSLCQLLRMEGATWSAWLIPTAVFLDRSRYIFFQVALQLYLRGGSRSRPVTINLSRFRRFPSYIRKNQIPNTVLKCQQCTDLLGRVRCHKVVYIPCSTSNVHSSNEDSRTVSN
jgi:hypothetical protein